MTKCKGVTKSREHCKRRPSKGQQYCRWHLDRPNCLLCNKSCWEICVNGLWFHRDCISAIWSIIQE